jgi:pentatricopeptide repeat protein
MLSGKGESNMANTLEARFLGAPVIRKNGREIFFPYNKVNALVYYILVKRTVMRDELSGILWGDKSDAVARKNLRNAIYETKKLLGSDIFISPRKAIIKMNPDVQVKVDVYDFEEDPANHLSLYQGNFLQGFYIKDSPDYESWYLNERDRLEGLYIDALFQKLKEAVATRNMAKVSRYGRQLIAHNPYDESIYLLLLRTYCEQGNMHQALDLYDEMKKLFREELHSSVPPEIEVMMQKASSARETSQPTVLISQEEKVLGREKEQQKTSLMLDQFLMGQNHTALLLRGAPGSGKTLIKDAVLTALPPEVTVIQSNCYQPERNILLCPWMSIMEGLRALIQKDHIRVADVDPARLYKLFPQLDMVEGHEAGLGEIKEILKFDAMFHTLYSVLEAVTETHQLIIVFEDIQWMDSLSLSLLSSLVWHQKSGNYLFLLTSQDSASKELQQFQTTAAMYRKLRVVDLLSLTRDQVKQIVQKSISGLTVTDSIVEHLWNESEGNLFLLKEYLMAFKTTGSLDNLTENIRTIFRNGCAALTDNQRKILDFISLFYDGAPLAMISEYMHMSSLQVLENLEALERNHYIKPIPQQPEVLYEIIQQKLCRYIRQQISPEKWRILHSYVAGLWEKRLTHSTQDIRIYRHLEYHYKESGELVNMGRYKLKTLMYYLNFSNELFPVLDFHENRQEDREESSSLKFHLDELVSEVDEMMHTIYRTYGNTPEVKDLEMTYLHLMGRHCIRTGEYEKGVRYILNLIQIASGMHNLDYLLIGYKQMIYYDIQIGNTEEMKNYLELALNVADECDYHKERGILLRLKGLNMIMKGDFPEAEQLLRESISTFMVTQSVQRRYALDIAGAYNYLGEIRRGMGRYQEALDEYDKALEYAKDQDAYSSRVVFCCNAGIVCYAMGRYEPSERYFRQAYELFPRYNFYWRHPVVEAYLALLFMRKGKEKEAIGYLDDAMSKLGKINNPREAGYVYMAVAFIKHQYPTQNINAHYPASMSSYATKALQVLDPYRDTWERQQLENLFCITRR